MDSPHLFRIYAKILGYSLPSETTEIEGCVIQKMNLSEQKKRKFRPLNIKVARMKPENFYKSYMAFGVASDTRIFKTNYVIYTDIENHLGHDVGGLIGVAIRRFDKVAGALSLTASAWFSKTYNRAALYKGCDYQISKIYEIKNGKEIVVEHNIVRGGGSQINLPDGKALFSKMDSGLLKKLLRNSDDTFKKSLKYLMSGERSLYLGHPAEKVMLDMVKSIEIVVKSFSNKNTRSFKRQLKVCAKKIGLTSEEQEQIMSCWKARSEGDVAHASKQSRSEYLPPQYPVPSDAEMNMLFRADLPVSVLLKYFHYKDGEIRVVVGNDTFLDVGTLTHISSGGQTYYGYKPRQNEKKNIVHVLKKQLVSELGFSYRNIKKRSRHGNEFLFKTANELL